MGTMGSPSHMSLLQAAMAQRVATGSKDRRSNEAKLVNRRVLDRVDLSVRGIEAGRSMRDIPRGRSEQADQETDAHGPTDRMLNITV